MAGSLLGQDQVKKVNALYGQIYSHVKSLLKEDASPVDLMRVHVLTEYLDTTELSRIFMELSFLSPAEKRALVRAAIFDVVMKRPVPAMASLEDLNRSTSSDNKVELKTYTPGAFKLNVATTGPTAKAPETRTDAVVPTVLTKLDGMRLEAKIAHEAAEAERKSQLIDTEKIYDLGMGSDPIDLHVTPSTTTVEDHQVK